MWDDVSANLSMPLMLPAQAQKHVTHNDALMMLDALVQLTVLDRSLTTPPLAPAQGERHIVPLGAGGAWGGAALSVAVFEGADWRFYPPQPGWRAIVLAEEVELIWLDGAWKSPAERDFTLAKLGINTTPDATNRLAVSAPATLLTHEGASHQLKINRATLADTASLLYQTGWSGGAEMGLVNSADFSIKVSPDGSSWAEALRAEAASGHLIADHGLQLNGALTGTAVTQSPTDTTAGRVIKVGDFGLGGGAPSLTGATSLNSFQTGGCYTLAGNFTDGPAGAASSAYSATLLVIQRNTSGGPAVTQIMSRSGSATELQLRVGTGSGPIVWQPWVLAYHSGNLLGAVSQAAGLPTGSVIERGSNANGEYARFADGTQICTHGLSTSASANTIWTFPAAFAAGPRLIPNPNTVAAGAAIFGNTAGITTTTANFNAWNVSGARVAIGCNLTAIGRWF